MTSTYIAKYAFNGNAAQSQLTFPANASIVARDGQEGKPWYWGNYNGRDGWFPPNDVQKVNVAVTPQGAGMQQGGIGGGLGGNMQQQMAGAKFASSVPQKQQPQRQSG
eukprot:275604_1